jgi:hypothetical protein
MDRLLRSSSRVLAGVAALALGCTGSDLTLPEQGLPANIVVVRGDAQTAAVGSALPDSLVVRVTDSKDRPIQRQQVTFAPSAGTVVPTAATTNADGRAGAIWVLGPVAGPQSATATATGNGAPAGLAVTFHATALTSGAARLDKAAGDGQSATAGSAVATPPAVKVSDKDGNPVSGVAVTFAVASGGGAVNPTTPVTTNASGVAAVTTWTLGTVAGPNTLTATVALAGIAGSPATFTATGTVGSAGKLAVVQQPSAAAQSGVVFPQQPKVQVQDAGGNPVKTAGLAVTATIASGAGAALGGQLTVATDGNGVASFANLVLKGALGAYTLGFTSPTLSGAASAAITLGAGAPTQLVIVQQPAAVGQSGVPLTQQPAVQLQDAQGNPVPQAGVQVTAALNGGAGTLSGTKAQTDATGKAAFTNLAITGPNGQYTLIFTTTAPSLASLPSGTIALGAGTPAALLLATAPSASAVNGQAFPQQPAIQVQDGAGNPVAAPGITITVAITAGGGTLGGASTAVTNAAGLATFAGLSITGTIGPHQLTFTSTTPPLTFTTANVSLIAGAATQIARHSASPQSATVGAAVPAPPSVLVRDASLNPVAGVAVSFAVTGGGGSVIPTTPILTDATGVATLTRWTLGPTSGANSVSASAPGLAGSPVAFNATGVGVLTITTSSPLPPAEVGAPYSTSIGIAGGSAPYTWSFASGSLPAGLSLNTNTGGVSGTPTVAGGPVNFAIRVTDVTSASTSKAFALAVLPAVTIATASLPGGTVGVAYSQTLAAANGQAPYAWSVSAGALPAGLVLTAATGALSGTPTIAGPFSFTIKVTDALGGTATRVYSGSIASAPSVTTASLPNGEIGVPYSTSLAGTGGTPPYTWTLSVGALPNGLGLSAAGTISGTPTLPAGTSSFTVQLTDAATATASKGLSILVQPAVAITTASLPNGAVGVGYSQQLAATGGQAPLTWSLAGGVLPTGLTLNAGGLVSGTPTTATGSPFGFTVRVTDALGGTSTQGYVVSIAGAPTITNTSPLQAGEAGVPYLGATLAATGGQPPYTFSVQSGSLDGLALNGSTGAITGTPAASGNFVVTFQVTDGNTASSTKALTIPVRTAVSITTSSLASGSVGTAYNQALAAGGGQAPFTWTLASGTLPPGLGLSSAGVISGTPTAGGTFNGIGIQVTDALGGTAGQTYSIIIAGAATNTSVGSSDANSVFGEAVTFTANVTSGAGTPTGSVVFKDGGTCSSGGTVLDTETLVSGSAASVGISTLSVSGSPHTILACYQGGGSFASSNGSVTQTVNQAATTTGVASSANPSVFGQTVMLTATVTATAPGSGTPTGNVRFQADGSNIGGLVALSGGVATRNTSGLAVGAHVITATYNGNGNFQSSAGTLSGGQTVNQGATTTTITSNLSVATTSADPITVSYDVNLVAPAAGAVNGGGASVTVSLDAGGGGESCTGSVAADGTGSCTIAAPINPGTPRTVTAVYSGNTNFSGSSSSPVSHDVTP